MTATFTRLTALILLLTPGMTGFAQWSSDPATNSPICRAGDMQILPRLVSDGSGGAFICWSDERTAKNFYKAYVQRIDRNGFVRWAENGIAVSPAFDGKPYPDMVSDGAGGVILVWMDERNGNIDVYAQRIDSSGNLLWNPQGVPVASGPLYQSEPKLVSDGQHGAIVTWSAHSGTGQDGHIYAQRIDGNGNRLWNPEITLSTSDQFESNPCIASDGSGGAYIAWAFYNNQEYDVYAQRVHANGGQQWQGGGVLLTSNSGAQDTPALVADGTGKAFLSYYDWGSGSTPVLQLVVLNGDGSTAAALRATSTSGGQRNPRMANIGTGLLGIVWEDGRAGSNTRSYAQIIDNTGKKSWAPDGVEVSTGTARQATPFVIPDGSGGMIVCWEDMTGGITESDVYAQKFSATGARLWGNTGAPLATAARMQQFPWMISDGAGGAIAAWEDYRFSFSNPELYASRILSDGTLPLSPPVLTLSAKSVAFGAVSIGGSSTKNITLTNTGDHPLTISSVTASDVRFSLTAESSTIDPKSSVGATVRFDPTSKEALSAFIVIESNSVLGPDTVAVTGSGFGTPEIQLDRLSLNFGEVKTGASKSLVLNISNPGNDTLVISSITTDNPLFTVAIDARALLPGESFDDTVTFSPTAEGLVSATLTVTSNAPTSPTTLPLRGAGSVVLLVSLTIEPTYIYFGDVNVGEFRDTTLTVTNTGNDTLRIASFTPGDAHFTLETAIETIAPAASQDLTIRFTPTAKGSLSTYFVMTSNAVSSPDTIVAQGMGVEVVSVGAVQTVPGVFTLHANYPNPFRSSTAIRYDLEASAPVRLSVYDTHGRRVATLVDETQRPGTHSVLWNPADSPPGVYLLVMRVGTHETTGRMLLMK